MFFRFLGIAGAALFLIGDMPYLLDTIKAKTKPHRVTWGIFALLNGIGFANQFASGATNSLWLFGAGTIMTGAIFLASLKNGVGGQTKTDITCLIIGLLGVSLWLIFDSPVFSIITNLIAALFAVWPTFIKAVKHPETETKIAWLLGAVSSMLTTISVGKLDWRLLVLPGSSVLINLCIVYLLYLRPQQKPKAAAFAK